MRRRQRGLAQTTAAAAGASAPIRSSAPDARHRLQGAALVRALRDGGLIIYFRHTATDFSKNDQQMRGFDDCANQRPLNDQGRTRRAHDRPRIAALRAAAR